MGRITLTVVVGVLAVLLIGTVFPAAAPITLTTPESGSMEPTVSTHSLAVVVDIEPTVGDIILFDSPDHETVVLHRSVGVSPDESGFETQGDANLQTDQAVGDPPVTRENIRGVVPEIYGVPLAVPYIGLLLQNPVFVIGMWVLLGLSLFYTSGPGKTVRGVVSAHPTRVYMIALGLLITIILPIVILTTPFTIETNIITSTTSDPSAAYIAAPGETTERTVSAQSPALMALHTSTHETGSLHVTNVYSELGNPETRITVRNEPVTTPTAHTGVLTIYTYPPVLPQSLIQTLASIHPILAAVASGVVIGMPISLIGVLMDPKLIVRATRGEIFASRR